MARSLNKVVLIGNLTRDPELRYTPQGTAVCSFGLATNRQWTTEDGEKKESAEFHNIVAWRNLAENCGKYLKKGSKVYVEGRLQTRKWTGQDNFERRTTEVIANDVMFLDPKGAFSGETVEPAMEDFDIPDQVGDEQVGKVSQGKKSSDDSSKKAKDKSDKKKGKGKGTGDEDQDDDIPF